MIVVLLFLSAVAINALHVPKTSGLILPSRGLQLPMHMSDPDTPPEVKIKISLLKELFNMFLFHR